MNELSLFWDASAVVPLMLPEKKSSVADCIWKEGKDIWAWDWLQVEVDAALIRRKGDASAWRTWRKIESMFDWSVMEQKDTGILRLMNRSLGLRAADAGHVYMFDRLSLELPGLLLVSFDREMVTAAQQLGLPVHPACIQS